ncbi:caspase domain-containing protein [Streptomyces cinerochromogenes]|uniref:Caspase domain-containing protein n=1 Tax=Streptomyces cinerochromogenes TaxID=66422 RepID=A0ABW7BLN0_9ACTN
MRKRALLIGCQLGDLSGVHADVALMDELLASMGFETTPLVEAQATRQGIIDAYRGLVEDTTSVDAALVYYSGHGGRRRNPAAEQDPSLPPWWQFLCPTDFETLGAFRGLLAEQLSQLQFELTAKTANVTTILDCCHAARMARDGRTRPKAHSRAEGLDLDLVRRAWQVVRSGGAPSATGLEANQSAVRLVACAPDESAFELSAMGFDGTHGALTGTLARLLRQQGREHLTWRRLIEQLRPAVRDLVPSQRPDVEGPVDRYLFQLREATASGVLPVRTKEGHAFLDAAQLFGIGVGDTYAIMPPSSGPATPLAVAVVDHISGGAARLRVRDFSPTALPPGSEAHPLEVGLGRRPVSLVPATHPDHARVASVLVRTAHLRVAETGEPAMATVSLDGGLHVLDEQGAPMRERPRPTTDPELTLMVDDLQQLARAAHVRDLESGTGAAHLDDQVVFTYARQLPNGNERSLERSGEHLFSRDRVIIRIHNRSGERRYVSVFDIGLRGAISLLTTAERSGVGIDPDQTYELFRLPVTHHLAGIEMFWPEGLPASSPRLGTFLGIVTDQPQDLTRLTQRGLVRQDAVADGLSDLQRHLGSLVRGVRDGRLPPENEPIVRYRAERFDSYLHAEARREA